MMEMKGWRGGPKAAAAAAQGQQWRLGDDIIGSDNGKVPVTGARSGGGLRSGSGGGTEACGGDDGDWTPSPAFCEQPLEMEETPLFSQMMAMVCGVVPSPHIEPKMGREEKGPT